MLESHFFTGIHGQNVWLYDKNLKILKTVRFWNKIFNWTTLLGHITSNNTYCSKEEFPKLESLTWSKTAQFLSSAKTRTAFGNEKAWTPNVFSRFLFFLSKYYLAYLLFILSFKRCISTGMEQKKQEFLNHSDRVDGSLPAKMSCKPWVNYA